MQNQAERMFPIQSQRGAKPHPTRIPWSIADLAYSVYSAMYGRGQSLERLAERGGFGPGEMDIFLPDWRERCDRVTALEAERDALRAGYAQVIVDLQAELGECRRLLADAVTHCDNCLHR